MNVFEWNVGPLEKTLNLEFSNLRISELQEQTRNPRPSITILYNYTNIFSREVM